MLIPDIRRVYSRPWRNGGFANPGKVATCVQVAVRPETTVYAHETMPDARADVSTVGTGPDGVGRVHVLNGDAHRFGLVFDEDLKPEALAMPSGAAWRAPAYRL